MFSSSYVLKSKQNKSVDNRQQQKKEKMADSELPKHKQAKRASNHRSLRLNSKRASASEAFEARHSDILLLTLQGDVSKFHSRLKQEDAANSPSVTATTKTTIRTVMTGDLDRRLRPEVEHKNNDISCCGCSRLRRGLESQKEASTNDYHSKKKPSSLFTHCLVTLKSILLVLVLLFVTNSADACSSRSTPKPRPPSQSAMRPNITFQTYACPPAYAAWYCLNGATCFTVKIADSILYNCECADGYMGQRCEFKDLEGSYLPARERFFMSRNSKVGNAFLGVLLIVVAAALVSAAYTKNRTKTKRASISALDPVTGLCCNNEQAITSRPSLENPRQDKKSFFERIFGGLPKDSPKDYEDFEGSSHLARQPRRIGVGGWDSSVLGQSISYSLSSRQYSVNDARGYPNIPAQYYMNGGSPCTTIGSRHPYSQRQAASETTSFHMETAAESALSRKLSASFTTPSKKASGFRQIHYSI